MVYACLNETRLARTGHGVCNSNCGRAFASLSFKVEMEGRFNGRLKHGKAHCHTLHCIGRKELEKCLTPYGFAALHAQSSGADNTEQVLQIASAGTTCVDFSQMGVPWPFMNFIQ